jgi:hypothetical protein
MDVKSEKELTNLMEQVQFNNGYAQRMTKMVIESKDLEVVERTQKVMQEVNEAAQRSCSILRMVPEEAGILQSGFEADSVVNVPRGTGAGAMGPMGGISNRKKKTYAIPETWLYPYRPLGTVEAESWEAASRPRSASTAVPNCKCCPRE